MSSQIINHPNELDQLATDLLEQIIASKVVLFYGEMGSGKTTFIKSLLRKLSSSDEVSSPTYSIVNEYTTPKNNRVFHFDLYRLNSLEEILDIGFEEYLESDDILLIEWPQKIEHLVESGLKIEIEKMDLNQRKFSIFKF